MPQVVATVISIRFALSARRDLLLESLALRHQLSVLARSNRRFRPSNRLLCLFLRWLWPRWREALVLVLSGFAAGFAARASVRRTSARARCRFRIGRSEPA